MTELGNPGPKIKPPAYSGLRPPYQVRGDPACVPTLRNLSLRAQRGNLVVASDVAPSARSPRRFALRDDKLGTRERGDPASEWEAGCSFAGATGL